MKKLFVHQPLFRLLSPVISGVVIYLLVLLLNNNVEQAQEQFFNEELYFCIVLSYLIQEFSRGLLLLFRKFVWARISVKNTILQIVISMLLCVIISSVSIILYFENILGFSASVEEIYVFDSIFCTITFIYILLYISHQYLYKINSEKLEQEQLIKQNIEEEFKQFKKGINPNLLFGSFESLLILSKTDKEKSDDFIDHLATIYRYILSGQEKQLVNFKEEFLIVKELISLLNYLPYSNISFKNTCNSQFLVVPGSLLFIVEQIVRTTIVSSENNLFIAFNETANELEISYQKNDKITLQFNLNTIKEIISSYKIYNKQKVSILEDISIRKIVLPKLKITNEL